MQKESLHMEANLNIWESLIIDKLLKLLLWNMGWM